MGSTLLEENMIDTNPIRRRPGTAAYLHELILRARTVQWACKNTREPLGHKLTGACVPAASLPWVWETPRSQKPETGEMNPPHIRKCVIPDAEDPQSENFSSACRWEGHRLHVRMHEDIPFYVEGEAVHHLGPYGCTRTMLLT